MQLQRLLWKITYGTQQREAAVSRLTESPELPAHKRRAVQTTTVRRLSQNGYGQTTGDNKIDDNADNDQLMPSCQTTTTESQAANRYNKAIKCWDHNCCHCCHLRALQMVDDVEQISGRAICDVGI